MRTAQLTKCFEPLQKVRARFARRKIDLGPQIFITDRSNAVFLLWFSIDYVWCRFS